MDQAHAAFFDLLIALVIASLFLGSMHFIFFEKVIFTMIERMI